MPLLASRVGAHTPGAWPPSPCAQALLGSRGHRGGSGELRRAQRGATPHPAESESALFLVTLPWGWGVDHNWKSTTGLLWSPGRCQSQPTRPTSRRRRAHQEPPEAWSAVHSPRAAGTQCGFQQAETPLRQGRAARSGNRNATEGLTSCRCWPLSPQNSREQTGPIIPFYTREN